MEIPRKGISILLIFQNIEFYFKFPNIITTFATHTPQYENFYRTSIKGVC